MFRVLNTMTCVVASILLSSPSFADNFKANNFEVGASSLFQSSSYSVSPLLRYAPELQIAEKWTVGVSADLARHKFDDNTNFNALNLLLNARASVTSEWSLGASAGTELRDCSGCSSETLIGASLYRAYSFEFYGLKGQSLFAQAVSLATSPQTTGLIVGSQFQF